MILQGRSLVSGDATGEIAAIAPLSFWGGYDPVSGTIIDRSHPALGQSLAGRILVMSSGRGSSSSSSVLAEAIRRGTAPTAIVLATSDPILAVGALVAEMLYDRTCPIAVLAADAHTRLAAARAATLRSLDGKVLLEIGGT
jgi:predicted aconitase with swiveling domain